MIKTLRPSNRFRCAIISAFVSLFFASSFCPQLQARAFSKSEAVARIRRAHILSTTTPETFASYRLTGCMQLHLKQLPIRTATTCIPEDTGVLQPSSAYVSVLIGPLRVTEVIDIRQAKGWQLTSASPANADSPGNVTDLHESKYAALLENTQHSLIALLGLLNDSNPDVRANLIVSHHDGLVVIRWSEGQSVNEFFFDGRTFLCVRQVRTVRAGSTVFKYSNYLNVSTLKLPHTIVMANSEGTNIATRTITRWALASHWPVNSFDPTKMSNFDN